MILILWILVFFISIGILVKSADYFTEASEYIGNYFNLPVFITGVIIVGFGTSLPELATSILATLNKQTTIVAANVIGSNIANILLVLGVAAIIGKKLIFERDLIKVDLPLLGLSLAIFVFCIYDGIFNRTEAVISLIALVIYIFYTITYDKSNLDEKKHYLKKSKFQYKQLVIIILSILGIYYSSKYTIESVIAISKALNIGSDLIAASAIAFGTSLPELMVTVQAVLKKKYELAVGNVLGSNIINVFLVMGIPALIMPLTISITMLTTGLLFLITSTLLFVFVTQAKEVTKWEGWLLFLIYIIFLGKLFMAF